MFDLEVGLIIGLAGLALTVAAVAGLISGKVEFRPFRTSAVAISLVLLTALWLTFHYDVTGAIPDGYTRGFVDGSIVMVVFTGLVTSVTNLTNDGGESEAVAVTRMFLESKNNDA